MFVGSQFIWPQISFTFVFVSVSVWVSVSGQIPKENCNTCLTLPNFSVMKVAAAAITRQQLCCVACLAVCRDVFAGAASASIVSLKMFIQVDFQLLTPATPNNLDPNTNTKKKFQQTICQEFYRLLSLLRLLFEFS